MAEPEVLYEVQQRIATVTLNRPARLNAYTAALGEQLRAAMRRAADDPGVRVIVLTGAGRGFCAGADMGLLGEIGDDAAHKEPPVLPPFDPTSRPDFHGPDSYFPTIPKPIVCALNGVDGIALTKIDVLDTFKTIKVATGYELGGKRIDYFPSCDVSKVKVIYEEFPGWNEPTSHEGK